MLPSRLNDWFIATLTALLAVQSSMAATSSVLAGYRLDRWTTADGLPQNKIESILQSSNGYIWVGTQHGLARFDGVEFTVIRQAQALNTVLPAVPALAQASVDGGLWIGTSAGLFRLYDHQLTWFTETNGLPHRKVWKLLARAVGELWIETEVGLCRFENGKFRRIGQEDGLPDDHVRCWAESQEGDLWVGTETWRRRYDDPTGRFVEIPLPGLPDNLPIRSMAFSRSGDLLLGTDHGLYRGKKGHWEHFGAEDGLGDPWIHLIFEDSTRQLWVGTKESGLHCLDGKRFRQIDLGIFDSEFAVDRMCEDREGNLWVATREGLVRLQRQPIRTLTVANGLADNRISTVYAGPDDTVWIGSGLGLSWVRPNGGIGSCRHPFARPQSNVCGLCVDGDGTLWAGAFGLFQFRDDILLPTGHFAHLSTQSIYKDRSGALYVGTEKGVSRYDRGEKRWFPFADGLGANGGDVFLEDSAGNLWIGNDAGLHRLRDGRITRFSESDGLAGGGAKAILEDKDGSLWIGNDGGLLRFAQDGFVRIGLEHGLPEPIVHQILDDGNGFIWLSGLKGLHRVSRDELLAVAEGRQLKARFISLDEADGMLSGETSGGIAPAGCRTRDGRLWFPTIKGVVVVEPKAIRVNDIPPPVVIEQVKADEQVIFGDGIQNNQSLVTSPPTRIGPGRGRVLEIRYTANSFVAPEKIRFQYRLEGRDKKWIDAENRRFAFYTDLRPGSYSFRVKASNNHGVWNEAGDSFAFAIAPRFTETVAFYFAIAATILGIGLGLHRFRLKHQRHIQSLEHQLAFERERSRIAQDIHDDVGASLTRIQLLGEVVEAAIGNQRNDRDAQIRARDIATTARQVAQRMDEIVWAVNPEQDTLASFVDYICHAAQEIFEPTEIGCRLDVPDQIPDQRLPSETRHNLYLLVKESLHNVVKHSMGTEAVLRLRHSEGELTIVIEDNGRGFDPAQSYPAGNGLRSMSERTRKLGGTCHIESIPGAGTKLRFEIPLP
ncbi:MAG: histidine kinase [Verrucomicrobiales bacterium]|nr:histidine kinase [Verrucomicrobiales bacterium]